MINMNDLEKKISKAYESSYTYFTGNATTALYILFKSLDIQKRSKILFPDITCMTPVNAAVYAGYEPVFCDVNRNDFTISIESLKRIIKEENVGIAVPTHIYGHICNMKEIYKICTENDIIVVEDAAQAALISQYNDYAVTSFGHTKIMETVAGGGAIFYKDNKQKERFDKYTEGLNSVTNEEVAGEYRREYYKIAQNLNGQQYYDEMRKLQYNSSNVFLGHFKENNELFKLLDNKQCIITDRNRRTELYYNNLDENYFELPNIHINEKRPLWRMTVLVKNINRDKFVKEVRKNNIDISTWYPQMHKFYSKQSEKEFKNSEFISNNLVNFWVTEEYSVEKILDDINNINIIARGIKNE